MTQGEAKRHESHMRNLAGIFSVEGLSLSPAFCRQLDVFAAEEELRMQLLRKYTQENDSFLQIRSIQNGLDDRRMKLLCSMS